MAFSDDLRATGLSLSEIAELLSVANTTARSLCNGKYVPTQEQVGEVAQYLEDMATLKALIVAHDLPVLYPSSYAKLTGDIEIELDYGTNIR